MLSTKGAELLGWQDRIGSLETGKFADIIAVDGNPLADIKQVEHVKFVMKGGVVVKDEHKGGKWSIRGFASRVRIALGPGQYRER